MGGLKFEKPIEMATPPEEPLQPFETSAIEPFPKINLAPLSSPTESQSTDLGMKIIPDLNQNSGVRYSADLSLVRVSASDIPLIFQKPVTEIVTMERSLMGISQSLVVFFQPQKMTSGAKKGVLTFLGGEMLTKLLLGEFLTGPYAWAALAYFTLLGAYLGWMLSKNNNPPPPQLPPARLLGPGTKIKK
jgi:hypothetical protein